MRRYRRLSTSATRHLDVQQEPASASEPRAESASAEPDSPQTAWLARVDAYFSGEEDVSVSSDGEAQAPTKGSKGSSALDDLI